MAANETVTYPGDSLASVFIGVGSYNDALAPTDASNNNRVTVNDTSLTTSPDFVFGGYNTSGASTGNTVTLNSGATVTSSVYGGFATNGGSATGNTVILNSGATVLNVSGGRTEDAGSASGNTVILNPGATVNGDVYGGVLGTFDGTTADNNTVIFHAGAIVNGDVYGGNRLGLAPTGAGNTLELRGAGQNIGGDLAGFQNLNFYLPSTLASGGTMLTVTGEATITGATVNVGIDGGSSPLKAGDTVTLINAGTLTGTAANTSANGQGMQGVTLLYEFDILADALNNKLLVTVTSAGLNPQLKSLSEGRVAGAAFVNQGSDLIIGPGMHSALSATSGAPQGGLVPFAAGQGGWSRYNTGSHVDVSGASMMTGLGWRQPLNEGKSGSFLAGAFFEAGWGGYDSHNSFSNAASVNGDGDISYYGGGILGRYDAPMTGPGNMYVDASFRAGHASTDFSSNDLDGSAGRNVDYDSGSAYYGAHAGLGYLWNITGKASLDLSTRYIWTHQNSDSVKVLGDPVKFDSVNSQRWRTGARFAYAVCDYAAPYVGAYYDHEFDGKAKASTNGYNIDAPDLKGGTGMGELGLTVKPVAGSGFSMDLGVQGYTGVREGVSGSVQLKFEF